MGQSKHGQSAVQYNKLGSYCITHTVSLQDASHYDNVTNQFVSHDHCFLQILTL